MKEYKKEKQSERLQPQQVCGYSTSTHVGFSVKLGLQQQLKKRKSTPWKFGRAVQAGAGGDGGGVEGQEQGVEWSRRGRNSAVGCISVSRSDGWVVALFVLCCHTALAPAWALMRGGRTGQEHGGPPMQVICHAAVSLRQGDTWRQRGRGEAAKLTVGQAPTWTPTCGTYQHIKITSGLTRLSANWLQPHLFRQNLPDV